MGSHALGIISFKKFMAEISHTGLEAKPQTCTFCCCSNDVLQCYFEEGSRFFFWGGELKEEIPFQQKPIKRRQACENADSGPHCCIVIFQL